MDWLDLLAVQGTLKSLLQHHSSKASIFWCSAFFTVQLSHPYMTIGKTIALTRRTFVGKVMSLLLNIYSYRQTEIISILGFPQKILTQIQFWLSYTVLGLAGQLPNWELTLLLCTSFSLSVGSAPKRLGTKCKLPSPQTQALFGIYLQSPREVSVE